MGLMERIKSLFTRASHEDTVEVDVPVAESAEHEVFIKASYEDIIASFTEELDNGQRQLFHEYEEKREILNFTGATTALESLLARDTSEKHREFYRYLMEEMKIYLSHPEYGVKEPGPDTWKMPDDVSSEPDIQSIDGVMRYTFRGKGKIGYRRKEEK